MPHKAEQPLLALIEPLKASGAPVNTPEMIERETAQANGRSQAALTAALKTVKAAGYVFVRVKNEKKRRPKTERVGPTCVVTFADGEITRMTTWSAPGKPDLRRGIRLAWAAYESRTKHEPPAIAALHFEAADGESVAVTKFTTEQIAEAVHGEP